MLIALLVPLILAILLFTFALARAAIAKRVGPSVEALALGGGRQLPRYARHRLVRADHGLVQVPRAWCPTG